MILHSIRLKNIKCYGAGPGGDGVTVNFQPGANGIAGRNGHGKTTLIEALAYSLFLTEPEFEERLKVGTYFLRAGEKEGEIDVTFAHGGQAYRIERGLGQSKRRSKVVQLEDGSTCALDDAEVEAFLCRLLGFSDTKQLSELFSRLVGVKQGRLTWPFDSRPAAAKEFFEPLLDVAIFRECAARLGEAQDRFEAMWTEHNVKLATAEERIRERVDSRDKVQATEQQVQVRSKAAEAAAQVQDAAQKQRQLHEQKQQAFDSAAREHEEAKSALQLAAQRREADQQRVSESQEAGETARKTKDAHEVYTKAGARLRELQRLQGEKLKLQHEREKASNALTAWQGKLAAARQQSGDYQAQHEARVKQVASLKQQALEGQENLQRTQADFESKQQATENAKQARETLAVWIQNLQNQIEEDAAEIAGISSIWSSMKLLDAGQMAKAKGGMEESERMLRDLAGKLARAEEAKRTLSAQLDQIKGGTCPFLKEQCRQFDPKAIQSDLSSQEKEIQELSRRHHDAEAVYQRAKKSWGDLVQEESRFAERKKNVDEKVERLVQDQNRMFPPSAQSDLARLDTYLGDGASRTQIEPPAQVFSKAGWAAAGGALDVRWLRELATAQKEFLDRARNALGRQDHGLKAKFLQFETLRTDRVRQEQDLHHQRGNLRKAEREAAELSSKIGELGKAAGQAAQQADLAGKQISDLDDRLRQFANLDQEIGREQATQDENAENHKRHLGAKPLADQLAARQVALSESAKLETQAQATARQKREAFELAKGEFDPAALEQARTEAAAAATKSALVQQALREAESELAKERERLRQWQEACLERDQLQREMGRFTAAAQVSKLAAKILKASAPAVAQRLCHRISNQAQRLFNQINQEPIELEWNAEPQYALRISPGDRRFAMLSGGEQTKLALAMTLAMIQEFSTLRFAVFDEPTYAVDAESRERLAEAILEAQKAAGLEQLIVVSHDDAFEGKIENVVYLRKLAETGTEWVRDGE
jgi:DNA repair protein SbcC/Rad50